MQQEQTLVAILLLLLVAALPAAADPPGRRPPAFEDWRIDCTVAPLCAALTSIEGTEGEVLRLAVTRGEAPSLAVSTGLPLHLPDGLAFALGGSLERQAPWRTCGDHGCEAALPIDPALLEAFRRERGGAATFTLVNGERVRVPFSLMGFSAAFRALDKAALSRP